MYLPSLADEPSPANGVRSFAITSLEDRRDAISARVSVSERIVGECWHVAVVTVVPLDFRWAVLVPEARNMEDEAV